MNVCIDVGNTTIAMGFYLKDKIHQKLVHNTEITRTEDEYVVLLQNTLRTLNIKVEEVEKIIYSSVVPVLNRPFKDAIKRVFNKDVLVVGPGIKTGLSLKVDNPNEIGGHSVI